DIRRFPITYKSDLRAEQEAHPYFGRIPICEAGERREMHPSTGTTGRPVNTIWTRSDIDYFTDMGARVYRGMGVRAGDIIQNALSQGLWAGGISVQYFGFALDCFVIPVGASMTDRQIDFLLNLKTTVLVATPSFALYLSEQLRERGHSTDDLALRVGIFGGEAGTALPATRGLLEERLGLDAYDYYALTEIGASFTGECRAKAGIHWWEDYHLFEVLDPESLEAVPEGETGALVVTHLDREGFPLIRYWTGDFIQMTAEPCPCRRTHIRSPGGIRGRADDMVIFAGANFHPAQVEQAVRSFPELSAEYHILLDHDAERRRDTCVVQVESQEPLPDAEAGNLRDQLVRALREALLFRPDVEFLPPGSLERTTFKARRVTDHRRQYVR
ncbi:MAG: phenylacetate--CoA ligase family protein, partial [Nitrospinota bacterium]|nr:phenylacetate--CoA ligase family protein [Nitrospinota bacterium]